MLPAQRFERFRNFALLNNFLVGNALERLEAH